jgi:hypothetical protein
LLSLLKLVCCFIWTWRMPCHMLHFYMMENTYEAMVRLRNFVWKFQILKFNENLNLIYFIIYY